MATWRKFLLEFFALVSEFHIIRFRFSTSTNSSTIFVTQTFIQLRKQNIFCYKSFFGSTKSAFLAQVIMHKTLIWRQETLLKHTRASAHTHTHTHKHKHTYTHTHTHTHTQVIYKEACLRIIMFVFDNNTAEGQMKFRGSPRVHS